MKTNPFTVRASRHRQLALSIVSATFIALAAAAGSAQALDLHSASIARPNSEKVFPKGPGSDAANSYCLMCHSAGMVLNQPDLTEKGWLGEVEKMKNAFKAPIPESELPFIAKYLYSIKGSKKGSGTGAGS